MTDTSGSLRLFGAFGIDVFVHWSWFVAAAVISYLVPDPTWILGIIIALFAIVTLHEFGHALACRSVGGRANRIVLWPLGGIAFVRPPERPGAMLWTIAAGPLVNVALIPVTLIALFLVAGNPLPLLSNEGWAAATPLEQFVGVITWLNFALLVFNMLPIYPLDGGQILQALLWFGLGRARSLHIAASIGFALAIIGGAYALFILGSIWLTVIAGFVGMEALNGIRIAKAIAAEEKAYGQWEQQ